VTRVAVADLGTNSTRLLIADVDDGAVVEVERLLEITRLGAGVDRDGRLDAAAMERTLAALRAYDGVAREDAVDRRLAVATSAVRDSANRDAFIDRIWRETGFPTRVVDGDTEASLTFRGVMAGRPPLTARTVVIDVGGGSTEFATGDERGLTAHVSIDAGCVRATERWLSEDEVDDDALSAARAALGARFAQEVPSAVADGVAAGIAVAGTATTLAALDLHLERYDPELIHGHVVGRQAAEEWLWRLAALDRPGRIALGIEPGRAGVIVGGVAVLLAAMDRVALDEVTVSERDVLHGIALLAAEEAGATP
jgi:exopolyphosphatase/guanosine-5'-triphosphate,3'-diphosphate pyrophosphatase